MVSSAVAANQMGDMKGDLVRVATTAGGIHSGFVEFVVTLSKRDKKHGQQKKQHGSKKNIGGRKSKKVMKKMSQEASAQKAQPAAAAHASSGALLGAYGVPLVYNIIKRSENGASTGAMDSSSSNKWQSLLVLVICSVTYPLWVALPIMVEVLAVSSLKETIKRWKNQVE